MVPARNDPLPFYPLLVLLAGCLLAAAPHGPRLPWWVTMLAAAMPGWRAWAQWRNEILPRRWLLLLLVIVVHQLPQPWRGIVDAGVVLGLAWGLVSFLVLSARALRAGVYPVDPEVREAVAVPEVS